jgi:hypothetical protein
MVLTLLHLLLSEPETTRTDIFWDVTPCSPVDVSKTVINADFKKRVGSFSTLKVEVICTSKTLRNFYWTIRRHMPETGNSIESPIRAFLIGLVQCIQHC